jgi:hypothetical protein
MANDGYVDKGAIAFLVVVSLISGLIIGVAIYSC